jgi:Na+(H+)/acetate symporter ActP
MRVRRAFAYGVLGAAAISLVSVGLRALGLPIRLEILLGTSVGLQPNLASFMLGLAMHLAIGGAFGLLYGWLFERVWNHGGASTGMILGVIHAALIGMAVGLTPQFHPLVPERLPDPGPFFANSGTLGVLAFFGAHILYGAIVGHGYGHVAAEHDWAPLTTR